jgi:hypothetical protein
MPVADYKNPVAPRGAESGGHRVHVIDNYITQEEADILISEMKNPSETNPYPEYYAKRFGGTAFPYNKKVMDILIKYGNKANEEHKRLNGYLHDIYVFKGFGSWWQEGTKGGLHIDAQDPEPWIEWSTVIYLNEDFEGGQIYFPNQNVVYSPKALSAVFFPSAGSEYVHGITTVTKGNRHTALYMHTSLPANADPDFLIPGQRPVWLAQGYGLNHV